MLRSAVSYSVLAFVGFSPAFAAENRAVSNPVLQAFIADIEAGKKSRAVERLASVETTEGDLARTPQEVVDRLARCNVEKVETDSSPLAWVRIEWACKNGRLFSAFDLDYAKPYLTVAVFEDAAGRAAREAYQPSVPPPMLVPSSSPSVEQIAAYKAKRQNAFDAFGLFVVQGLNDDCRTILSKVSTVRIARRNPVHKVSIEETENNGLDALIAATQVMTKRLGAPTAFSCNPDDPIYQCKFMLSDPDTRLYATLGVVDGKVTAVEFLYATRESVQKDMAGPL